MKKIKLTAKTQALMGKSATKSPSDYEVISDSLDVIRGSNADNINAWTQTHNLMEVSKSILPTVLKKYPKNEEEIKGYFENFETSFTDLDSAYGMLMDGFKYLLADASNKSIRSTKADYADVARPIVELAGSINNQLEDLLRMAMAGGTASFQLKKALVDTLEALDKMKDFI